MSRLFYFSSTSSTKSITPKDKLIKNFCGVNKHPPLAAPSSADNLKHEPDL
jgi:hypothetical protein